MLVRVAALTVLFGLAGCHRVLRETKIEGPIDTGVEVSFGEVGGRELRWDFGDGTASAVGQTANHAFSKAGRYLVQGFDGEFLAQRVELVVVPRALPRAVPQDAQALLWVPSLQEDLGLAVDFFERVAGPGNLQRLLEQSWLPALAVELSLGEGSVVDPQEGVGLMMLPGFSGQIALLGVVDADRAMQALALKLVQAGAVQDSKLEDGARTFVAPWGRCLAFVDRGYLYLVQPEPQVGAAEVLKVIQRVRAIGHLGLQGYPPFNDYSGVGDGNVCLYAREGQLFPEGGRASLVQSIVTGLRVGTRSATLEGRLVTSRPLKVSATPSGMFARARQGPVAALKLSLPSDELADSLLAPGNSGQVADLLGRLRASGVDTRAALNAFTGEVGLLAWFDAEDFLKNLVNGTGKPDWRGLIQLIAGVASREAMVPLLTSLLGEPGRAPSGNGPQALMWQRKLAAATATIALTGRSLMIRNGSDLTPRTDVDLAKELGARFKGAFGPGHSSLVVDLARLKQELEAPRVIPGLDPLKVVTVQGFSSAFIDQLTPIDHLVLDFEPEGNGGKLWGMITLKAR